ncbi:MAG: hypothetical protein AABX93_02170 [Nanoarchaeota archaeon]
MGFKPKWTEEQNKRILELHEKDVSDADIAKELNSDEKKIRGRIYFLKDKEKKRLKKEKAIVKKQQKAVMPPKVKSETASEIHVSEAPIHPEAESIRQKYLENPENENLPDENTSEIPKEKEIAMPNNENEQTKIDFSGVANTITTILDKRFVNNDLKPLTQEEKDLFSKALNEVMIKRMEYYFKYGDIINLGLAGLAIFTPRILENLEKKKNKTENSSQSKVEMITPAKTISEEQSEAQRRYEQAMQRKA